MAAVTHSIRHPSPVVSEDWLDFTQHDTWQSALIAVAATPGIADICISSQGRVRLKVGGKYRIPVLHEALLNGDDAWEALAGLINPSSPLMGGHEFARDGGCTIDDYRFRYSRVSHMYGQEFTLRVLPSVIPTPAEVHLPLNLVKRFVDLPEGLIAFAGSTGNGKSTSIAALISENARRKPIRVVTIEDPVEYLHKDMPNGSTFTYRSVGIHAESFASGMRDALRMNPDILVIGEIRDSREAAVAIEASLTGRKVVTTLHGGNVEDGMQRLGDFAREIGVSGLGGLAKAFKMCVAQKLVPNNAGTALLPLHEILISTQSVSTKIRDGKFFSLRQDIESGSEDGMQTFEQSPFYSRTMAVR